MGCFGSKDKLSKEDMDFLKSHTRYDEATIKEWYKGFKVSFAYFYMRHILYDVSLCSLNFTLDFHFISLWRACKLEYATNIAYQFSIKIFTPMLFQTRHKRHSSNRYKATVWKYNFYIIYAVW